MSILDRHFARGSERSYQARGTPDFSLDGQVTITAPIPVDSTYKILYIL